MNITLTAPEAADLAALERLYLYSFPPEERRPWGEICAEGCNPQLLMVSTPDERRAGFVTLWRFGEFTYIEHLATEPRLRGGGVGAAVMAELMRQAAPLLLEVEHPTDPESIEARRIGFYRRCGLELLDYDYVQPPYAPGLPSVPLLLMCSDAAIDAAAAATRLHREVYKFGV